MPKNTLTARQAEILELIRSFILEEGCPPTRAEIAETLGFRSANAAEDHLRALERKGATGPGLMRYLASAWAHAGYFASSL